MRLLNLGCGTTFHPAWTNVDLVPSSPSVRRVDLRERLPFETAEFDVAYHSHVLEHFPADAAERFLREVVRVLRPGGVMRVVVPDLEQIARLYLDKLAAAERGASTHDHEWMLIELYDQSVRERSGGEMKRYLDQTEIANLDFVRSRIGAELDGIRAPRSRSLLRALRTRGPAYVMRFARHQLTRSMVRVVGGRDALASLDAGTFRRSGEIHHWMYDAASLRRLLERVGLRDVARYEAGTSQIRDFASYGLDAIDGVPRKPDSMFIEGIRAA